MNALTFTIELLEPMLATGLEGDPNAGVSMQYIAGSVMRGAVIGLWLRENKQENDLASHQRDLFFNEVVCFLNSYPVIKNKRSLPIPLSWHKEKDASENAGNWFLDFCFFSRDESMQYKSLSAKFFAFDGSSSNTILKAEVKTRIAVHNRRNPQKGRAVKEDGDIFRYESVAPKTQFRGAIIGEKVALLNEIKPLIDGKEVLLGGSRTAGYGRTRIICDGRIGDHWGLDVCGETGRAINKIEKDETFTITLLSNMLVRDANGQFQADLIAEHLGIDATLCKSQTFKRAELIGGFNRKWGLPLPQQISIKAGSVFTFKANQQIEKSIIEEWLNKGVGERRLDGFGRIAVNLNKADELYFGALELDKVQEVKLTGASATARTLAQKMNERILRQKFETKLIAQAGSKNIEGKEIHKSQISRLRLVVREAIRAKDQTKIQNFFDNLKKTARDQFDGIKISGKRAPGWIEEVLAKKDEIKIGKSEMPSIGGLAISETLLNELKLEYHLRLIDGVLARAAKDNQK